MIIDLFKPLATDSFNKQNFNETEWFSWKFKIKKMLQKYTKIKCIIHNLKYQHK